MAEPTSYARLNGQPAVTLGVHKESGSNTVTVAEGARQTLQRIIDRAPEMAAANLARNRLALLKLELKAQQKNEPVKMGTYEQNIGLKQTLARPHER